MGYHGDETKQSVNKDRLCQPYVAAESVLVFFSFSDEVIGTSHLPESNSGPNLTRHAAFLNKELLGRDPTHLFTLSVMALVPQWQSEVAVLEIMWLSRPRYLTIRLFAKKVFQPLL